MRFLKKKTESNDDQVERVNSGPEQSVAVQANDEPPDGGYGWVVVYALGQLNGFTWGVAAV